jgi:hypothetical protein
MDHLRTPYHSWQQSPNFSTKGQQNTTQTCLWWGNCTVNSTSAPTVNKTSRHVLSKLQMNNGQQRKQQSGTTVSYSMKVHKNIYTCDKQTNQPLGLTIYPKNVKFLLGTTRCKSLQVKTRIWTITWSSTTLKKIIKKVALQLKNGRWEACLPCKKREPPITANLRLYGQQLVSLLQKFKRH